MKAVKHLMVINLCLLLGLIFTLQLNAQIVPADVSSIVDMKLEAAQAKLKSLGYDICGSSFMSKKQDWYNESEKICVTIKFNKKSEEITDVSLNPNLTECQKGLEASRKVWDKYHDGLAPVNTPKIDEERKKLADDGFKVAYWVDEISPGRSSEYWANENTKKVKLIVWEVANNNWVMTNTSTWEMAKNPASKKQ